MEHLLDEELVMALQYVDVPDLLACRLVCKRLGELALHPDVWRHRRLTRLRRPWLTVPTLRLAPCLEEVLLHLNDAGPHSLYTETACVVASLRIYVNGGGQETIATALLVIRNQLALGRLRSVFLTLGFNKVIDAQELFDVLAYTCELEEIEICELENIEISLAAGITPSWVPNSLAPPPRPSLKRFRCKRLRMNAFPNFMLNAHAATLEAVHFRFLHWQPEWVPLLLSMPNLRELDVHTFSGMAALSACKALRKVVLRVISADAHGKDAEEFLRRAHQLQSVSLQYVSSDRFDGGGGLDLVLALAGRPAQSRVEALEIDDDEGDCAVYPYPRLQSLLATLPTLPALRRLELNAAAEGLAGALTPATAPALRTLRLTPVERRKGLVCAHTHLHKRSVQALMADNPLVVLHMRAPYHCLGKYTCPRCALGCHQDMSAAQKRRDVVSWVNMNQCYIPSNDSPPH